MGRRHRQPHHRAPAAPGPLEYQQEKQEQRAVVALYKTLGCDVVSFSQPRATMQTEGIPDLKVYCRRKAVTWWHECKVPGGKCSPAQLMFATMVTVCGEHYVLGGWDSAVEAVRRFGLVTPEWRPARPHV